MIAPAARKDGTEQSGPRASPGVTACEVDRPDSVSPAAVAERFHTAQAVRRTRAVIGCSMQATNIENPPWCALQRLARGCIGALVQHGSASLKAQGCLEGAFLFLRQPRIAGRRALLLLLLLPVRNAHLPTEPGPKQRDMSPPPTRPTRPTRPLHSAHQRPRRLTILDVIAVPAYRPLSRARGQQTRHCLMLTACRMPALVSPP